MCHACGFDNEDRARHCRQCSNPLRTMGTLELIPGGGERHAALILACIGCGAAGVPLAGELCAQCHAAKAAIYKQIIETCVQQLRVIASAMETAINRD